MLNYCFLSDLYKILTLVSYLSAGRAVSWAVLPLSPPAKSLLPSARMTLELGEPSPLRPKPS